MLSYYGYPGNRRANKELVASGIGSSAVPPPKSSTLGDYLARRRSVEGYKV